jgi:redox-sensitive bicupin YhaK (pirin superfamily)
VNWMTAGRGIAHSERSAPAHGQSNMIVEGIQLWIALPKSHEEVAPSFVHYEAAELPSYKQGGVEWRVIAGEYQGVRSPVSTYSPLFYFEASIKHGHLGDFPMPTTHEAALYVAKGEVQIEGVDHGEGVLVVFAPGSTVLFKAGSDSRVLIFGGEPLPEPRHIWWNFVSSSKERIEQAKVEWREQRFGKVPKEQDYIPLPEN